MDPLNVTTNSSVAAVESQTLFALVGSGARVDETEGVGTVAALGELGCNSEDIFIPEYVLSHV